MALTLTTRTILKIREVAKTGLEHNPTDAAVHAYRLANTDLTLAAQLLNAAAVPAPEQFRKWTAARVEAVIEKAGHA